MRNIVFLSFVLFAFTNVNGQDQPVYQWDFNGDPKISEVDSLAGLVQFVDGIRGQALVIDGYTTELVRPAAEIALPPKAFTISA